MRDRLLCYLLARAQERSTVAGVVAAAMAALGVVLPQDAVVNVIVALAGLAAALIPTTKK